MAPVIEILSSERIRATQKGAADTMAHDMESAEITMWGDLKAGVDHDASIRVAQNHAHQKIARERLGICLNCLGVQLWRGGVYM